MTAVADVDIAAIRESALACLSRREHSQKELQDKLLKKYADFDAIEQVVYRLIEVGLLSDERYTEQFVRHKTNTGKGPYVISQMLRASGIGSHLIEQYLETSHDYWLPFAQDVYDRKYRGRPIDDYAERAKRQRFMMSRGFSQDVISTVIA